MLVAVQLSVLGLYLPPVLKTRAIVSAPDDHFIAGPDGGALYYTGARRVCGAGSGPSVCAGIVSAAGVER